MNTRNPKKAAEEDFKMLRKFLDALQAKSLIPKEFSTDITQKQFVKLSKIKQKQIAEKQMIDSMIYVFKGIAEAYFMKAVELIEQSSQIHDISSKNYAYYQVLQRLVEHVQLLAELTDQIYSRDFWGELSKNQAIIEDIIDRVSTRFLSESSDSIRSADMKEPTNSNPLFLILLSPEFKYIRFTYMPLDTVVLGMPPLTLALNPRSLSVIWHEVGGHAIALNKTKLKDWVDKLPEAVWSSLKRLYTQGASQTVNQDNFEAAYELLESGHWREVWLGEFFEDLFGAQALREAMLKSLAEALSRRYPEPAVGDRIHPPLNLRLRVVAKFLELQKDYVKLPKNIVELPKMLTNPEPPKTQDPFKLSQVIKNSSLESAVQAIVELYIQTLGNADRNESFCTTICDEEKEIAEEIRKNFDFGQHQNFVEKVGNINRLPSYDYFNLYQFYKNRYKEYIQKFPESDEQRFAPLQLLITPQFGPQVQMNLKLLLTLRFTEVDRATAPEKNPPTSWPFIRGGGSRGIGPWSRPGAPGGGFPPTGSPGGF